MPGWHLRQVGAVVADDHAQSGDPIEFADDAQAGERCFDRQARTFPRKVTDQRRDAEAPATLERPAQIAILRDSHRQASPFAPAELAHGQPSSLSRKSF
jgi:hypothetical protein